MAQVLHLKSWFSIFFLVGSNVCMFFIHVLTQTFCQVFYEHREWKSCVYSLILLIKPQMWHQLSGIFCLSPDLFPKCCFISGGHKSKYREWQVRDLWFFTNPSAHCKYFPYPKYLFKEIVSFLFVISRVIDSLSEVRICIGIKSCKLISCSVHISNYSFRPLSASLTVRIISCSSASNICAVNNLISS